jgi:hypothetical protein
MSFGGLANCSRCWDDPEICQCTEEQMDAYYNERNQKNIKKFKARLVLYEHIGRVTKYMNKFAQVIGERAWKHDASKLTDAEFPYYVETIEEFEKYPYGSDGYNQAKASLAKALEHHYEHNSHHPEHYKNNGIDGMDLIDLLEMLADWKSATQNHPDKPGDMTRSLQLAVEKYKIDNQLAQILYNTIKRYELL